MAKNLSLNTIIEKNKLSSAVPFLVCLDIEVIDPATALTVETLYLVKNNENVTINGNSYVAVNFDIEVKEEAGNQPEISLTVQDQTQALQGRMQAYGGGVGFNVTLSVVRGDALTEAPEIQEFFTIIGSSASEYVVTFQLGAENHIAKQFPKRRQFRDFCSWKYKDADTCKYAGAMPSCDLTFQGPNGCSAHNNTKNFGGFPGIRNINLRY